MNWWYILKVIDIWYAVVLTLAYLISMMESQLINVNNTDCMGHSYAMLSETLFKKIM